MRTLAAFVLVVLTGPLSAQAPAPPSVVPFELLPSGHMAVSMKVNGKGPYRLIFDTGAPINLLTTKAAKAAGVVGDKPRGGFGWAPFGMLGVEEMKSVDLGGAKLDKVPAVVMDHPTVAAIDKVYGPIDGIVGFPVFSRYRTTVDYQAKTLTLAPNGYKPGDFLQGMMATVMRATEQTGEPKVVAAAGVWGVTVDKPKGDPDPGVTVSAVAPGGPAATAGLKVGDRVLTVDGRWTDSVADTFTAASLVKPGRAVAVVVKRDGVDVTLRVTPAGGV